MVYGRKHEKHTGGGERKREKYRQGERGLEIFEPPLCAACVVDMEVNGLSTEDAIEKGLRVVDDRDGGVTRRRKELKMGRDLRIDGEDDRNRVRSDPLTTGTETIWVNIFDPVNGTSFQPRPLKPIPLFMQVGQQKSLANARGFERTAAQRCIAPNPAMSRSNSTPPVLACSTPLTDSTDAYDSTLTQPETSIPDGHQESRVTTDLFKWMPEHQGISFVVEESLKRPSARFHCPRPHEETATMLTPKYPNPLMQSLYQASPPSTSSLPCQLTTMPSRTLRSSEYLERYQPVMLTTTPSARLTSDIDPASPSSKDLLHPRSDFDKSSSSGTACEIGEGLASETKDQRRGVGAELRRFFTGR